MKKLFKNLPVALLAMTLAVGCGKENDSGGSTGSSANTIVDGGIGNASQNFQTLQEARAAFDNKSMAENLSQGLDIYHVGPYFGGQESGMGFNASYSISGCLNLIFWEVGDCDGSGYVESQIEQMESVVASGRLIKVNSFDANSVNAQKAVGVNSDLSFEYSAVNLTRQSVYGEALSGTDSIWGGAGQVSSATISLSDGRRIEGISVFQPSTGRTFVLTTNLPLAANPVLVRSYSGQIEGYLSKIGPQISVIGVSSY